MATVNYIVVLDTTPEQDNFRAHYFPRGFHLQKEADDLVAEVGRKGGKAHVVPQSQFTDELLRQVQSSPLMKYKVYWEETFRYEVVVEATSKEEAENIVLEGEYDPGELEEDHEFNGVTKVEEVDDNPTSEGTKE